MALNISDSQVMRAIRADTNGPENKLLETLQYLEKKPAGQCAVHIHLSLLQNANKRPAYIRIAERSFDNITLSHGSELFILANFDIVLCCPSTKVSQIDRTLESLKALFRADPLVEMRDGTGEEAFSTWYDLEEDFDYFKEAVVTTCLLSRRMALETNNNRSALDDEKLTPKNLDALARMFRKLDASPLIRHQSAVQIGGSGQGQLLFREYFISIGELRNKVAPKIDLLADRWLFQFLTTILDQRVLHMLRNQPIEDLPRNLSLNLNVQTMNSKDFQLFDQYIGNQAHRVIIEFQPVDVFANVFQFQETRDILQSRGYKVLIDALQPLVLDYFDPSMLLADYYKIAWGDRLGGTNTKEGREEIRELIQSIGAEKVIISHVDSEEAVKFGLMLGVQRFQGFFVDRLVEAMQQKMAQAAGKF